MDDREPTPESDPADAGAEAAGRPAPSPAPEPSIADGEDHTVDPRSVRVARLIAVPLTLGIPVLPLAGLTLGWALGGIPTVVYLPVVGTLLLLAALGVTIGCRYPATRHRHLRYRADPDGLRIQRGVVWRKTTWVPITRVQHTDVSRGPLQRHYELATLTVYTAGTVESSIPLSGLGHGIATRLADHLRPDRERRAD
jgi:membrane protein YdbS with pleckstrin-like domain